MENDLLPDLADGALGQTAEERSRLLLKGASHAATSTPFTLKRKSLSRGKRSSNYLRVTTAEMGFAPSFAMAHVVAFVAVVLGVLGILPTFSLLRPLHVPNGVPRVFEHHSPSHVSMWYSYLGVRP